jgi:arylsulfatase A-like enzyme
MRQHVALATCCGLLLGLGEGLWIAVQRAGGSTAVLVSATAVAAAAALFGVVQGVATKLVLRLSERLGLSAWLRCHTNDDPEAPRAPVVGLHAAILGGLFSLVTLLLGLWLLLPSLDAITEPNLQLVLTLVVAGGLFVVASLAGATLAWRLRAPLARLDARRTLPLPREGELRVFLYVVLPSFMTILPLTIWRRAALGTLVLPLWLLLFLVAELWLARIAKRPLASLDRLRRGGAMVAGAVMVLLVASAVVFATSTGAKRAARKTTVVRACVSLLRQMTDIDRDGFSSLYGGGDCAAFNSDIHPLAIDVAGNGVDDNCDGSDSPVSTAASVKLERSTARARIAAELKPKRYNVVWIIVDAARADHCSVYGYNKRTTPFLRHLARSSLVFSEAFAASSATMMSIPAMFTGSDPGSIEWVKRRGKLNLPTKQVTLAERLREEGYRTAFVTGSYSKRKLPGMMQGFDAVPSTWLNGKRMPWYRRNAAVATTLAVQWLESDPQLAKPKAKPFFLVVYSADPHDPYNAHKEGFPDFGKDDLGRYDAEIAFADRYTGFLADYLQYRRPLWDDTIFIFTADHGEEFGEHDGKTHAYTCHRESTNVPLVMRIPGVRARRSKTPVSLIDIVPTLLDALGLEPGGMSLDGQSLLVPTFDPDARPADRPLFCSVLSQKAKQGNFFRRAVRARERVLMHDAVSALWELYDTRRDRPEKRNLIGNDAEANAINVLKAQLTASQKGNLTKMRLTK